MIVEPTQIHGSRLIKPKVFGDSRGFFLEMWNDRAYRAAGVDAKFVQDNHSRSGKNVLRGLHYQTGSAAQGKLVWVSSGVVFDVFVDLRRDSPTFGCWDGHFLTAETHERLWVPAGCAHGFLVVSDIADFHYKCTNYYSPQDERVLRWDDPALGVKWPIEGTEKPILSTRDCDGLEFSASEYYQSGFDLIASGGLDG